MGSGGVPRRARIGWLISVVLTLWLLRCPVGSWEEDVPTGVGTGPAIRRLDHDQQRIYQPALRRSRRDHAAADPVSHAISQHIRAAVRLELEAGGA
jgi:hypothetical protein